jgi:hypothetical protein
MDKTNLKRRVAELDEMVKALLGPPSMQQQTQLTLKTKVRFSCYYCFHHHGVPTYKPKFFSI